MRFFLILLFLSLASARGQNKLKVLILDGQNNHVVWPKSTLMMKQYLEEGGLFRVDIQRTKYVWKAERESDFLSLTQTTTLEMVAEPRTDMSFEPQFDNYDVVVSNFGWRAAPWPEKTKKAFADYIENGGGFVSVHAADNSFPDWHAYNQMIGLGGWGNRDESNGPYVYYSNTGEMVVDSSIGSAGAHGKRHHFPITIRNMEHPITKGMPSVWLSGIDECYAKLRGPAKNMTILATGKDQSDTAPTDRHAPVLMVVDYGKGRVFHTTLGHDTEAFENVGFITSFLRGVEWAATGKVTLVIPKDFPTETVAKRRRFQLHKK
ncbi:MAG: ThuA domain-containing protein [Bacteroidota bacterium]